ncbi:hypothetical protein HELRODRAFT_189284 [Helobdella robusta]|uniref:Acyl-coenzyme A oxidase n=1 Tax=Helobdella robusta TaxID=6412 RepID=T1FQX1_HELRO|nr:hypothetical protein HELRODRAFT_189284 [Helobdella robusta]ESN96549.1 hypothetical protein HELRODRAFT_189284 [Helobdella robusta]
MRTSAIDIEKKMNPLLESERKKNSFDVEEMTNVLDGGKIATERRRFIEKLAFTDVELWGPDVRHMTREELFLEMTRRHVEAIKKCKKYNLTDAVDVTNFQRSVLNTYVTGLSLHQLVFVPMLKLQSSEEQLRDWLPLVDSFKMIGCYAQTELGHGTYIRGIETSATYDPQTEEFILNSPSISSIKWWIGGLGKTANYALILAQLYTDDVNRGVHAFLVQIRDHNHMPMQGITLGDIGPKLGLNSVDNGFLKLSHVRIPRNNMLMRYSKVLKDGTFVAPSNTRLLYGGMLQARIDLSDDAIYVICLSITVVIRYSCVRLQCSMQNDQAECQIVSYQTQQNKLFPILSSAYAYRLAFPAINQWLTSATNMVDQGDVSDLGEAHALSSAMKVLLTTKSANFVETCRLSCGGHGYLDGSSLPVFYRNIVATVTAEGEVSVLLLQTARFLVKTFVKLQQSSNMQLSPFTSYLLNQSRARNEPKKLSSFNLESLVDAYQYRSYRLLSAVCERMNTLNAKERANKFYVWNACSVDLVHSSLAHIECVIATVLVQQLSGNSNNNVMTSSSPSPSCLSCSSDVRRVLTNLCRLYLLNGLFESSADLLQFSYLDPDQVTSMKLEMYNLYDVIRPDVVSLVDAMDFDDRHLKSVLGTYCGHVYEELYQWAQKSKLNETQVHPSFHKYVKPTRELFVSKM